jgi:hypothetical protein
MTICSTICGSSSIISIMSAAMNDNSSSSVSEAQQCMRDDVSVILAERRTVNGESELLVLLQPKWILKDAMHPDDPVLRHFRQAPKARFGALSALGTVVIPVEPGSSLAAACAKIADRAASDRAISRAAIDSSSDDGVAVESD